MMHYTRLAAIVAAGCWFLPLNTTAQAQDITAYCAMLEDDCRLVFNDFEAETGLKVAFTRLSSGEIVARVRAERENPQASLWFTGAAEIFVQAAREGLLTPYRAAGLEKISPNNIAKDNMWTPVSQSPLTIVYNEAVLADTNAPRPTGWRSFADPAYKRGGVALAHPAGSGTAYSMLATMVQIFGEDESFDILKKADANVVQYTRSGVAPMRMTASGEVGLGMVFLHDLAPALQQGYNISYIFPEEGDGYEINAGALVANGPAGQVAAARRFLDWILTEKGQIAMGKTFRAPVVPGYIMADSEIDLTNVKMIDYDFVWVGENRARLLERYEREVRRGSEAK